MTLRDTIGVMEMIASKEPAISSICRNDIYKLNENLSARYGVFAWQQRSHSTSVDSSFYRFNFQLFYVDRVSANRSNELEAQSVGVQVLDNILLQLSDVGIYVLPDYVFQPFTQRFADDCAGVYANVTLEVGKELVCPESYADFSKDFNEDFDIL